jgi:hypothetical protein
VVVQQKLEAPSASTDTGFTGQCPMIAMGTRRAWSGMQSLVHAEDLLKWITKTVKQEEIKFPACRGAKCKSNKRGAIMDVSVIENWFTYHAPSSDQLVAYDKLRNSAKDFAKAINDLVPDSADKTAAIRKVREAVMTANAAIACGGK